MSGTSFSALMALDCQSWLQEPADTGRTEVRADIHKVSSLQARHGAAAAAAAKSLQSCPTLRPHRRQPSRLPRPRDSPGKNTGVGCHFLLQCMRVKSESEVSQSCPTLRDPTDCRPPGSSVHRIFQARVLEWGAIAFSVKKSTSFLIFLFIVYNPFHLSS